MSVTERRRFGTTWDTLRIGICRHWMTQEWRTQEKIRAKKIQFQSEGHRQEGPMGYYYRKLRAIRVSFPGWDEFDIVRDILDNAPEGWQKYFNRQPNTLAQLCNTLKATEHLYKKDADIERNITKLMEDMEKFKPRKEGNSWSNKATVGAAKPFFKKANAHAAESKNPLGYHPKLTEYPFSKRDDVVTTKGQTPAEKNARPCRHCGSGKHWDNECPHARKAKAVHVHYSTAEADLLEAFDEYEDARRLEESEQEAEEEANTSEQSGNESASD